ILGGWVTTDLTWRVVFYAEVVLAIAILLSAGLIAEKKSKQRAPRMDWVGSGLTALGLSMIVFGVLQASNWGWVAPRNSPIEPFGLSLTLYFVAGGVLVLGLFRAWERRREERGKDPLVHFRLFRIPPLRGGLSMLLAQNLILMGIFFTIPLYLQIVQGLSALETGVRMLPASVALFLTAIAVAALAERFAPRPLVRTGLGIVAIAAFMLLGTVDSELDTTAFLVAMGVLGVGMGLILSQLGNVVQSSVGAKDRSEAGGLQYTAQQLGSSLGTALLGAVVVSGLIAAFSNNVENNPNLGAPVQQDVQIALAGDVSFVSAEDVRTGAEESGADPEMVDEVVDDYENAQLAALKLAFLFAGFIALGSFWATRRLPTRKFSEIESAPDPPAAPNAPT
ncbi:MAG: MFS transporter, partial [Solirubrobacterales bacterium]